MYALNIFLGLVHTFTEQENTSKVRRLDSLNPRLQKAEVYLSHVHTNFFFLHMTLLTVEGILLN